MDKKVKDELIKDMITENVKHWISSLRLVSDLNISNPIFENDPREKVFPLMGITNVTVEMLLVIEDYSENIIKLKNMELLDISVNKIVEEFIFEILDAFERSKKYL